MEEGYGSALMLLAIGMITVMFILALVVVFGGLLIKVINKYFPEPEVQMAPQPAAVTREREISPIKMAAILTAVDIATEGRGKVGKIEKV